MQSVRHHHPRAAVELVEALERGSGGLLELGHSTVYPLLYNLERQGLVEPFKRTAPSGRERKYYRITAAGGLQVVTGAAPTMQSAACWIAAIAARS